MRKPPGPTKPVVRKLRCAVYTRKSTEEGLDMAFNSLDAQREACEAYVASQRAEGWVLAPDRYDDGGFSGGTLERPALRRLLSDLEAGLVDVVVGVVLSGIALTFVHGLADIESVVEELIDAAFVDGFAALSANALLGKLASQIGRGAEADEALEHHADGRCLGVIHDELTVVDVVAERRPAAHPHAAGARGGELVANALADHLALELSEGEQDVQRQPPHAGRCVEVLGNGHERDAVPVECLDQPREVHQ
jgi:hypothetical protein